MSKTVTGLHEQLIGRLSRDLRPVARIWPVWVRVGLWLAAAGWIGLLLSLFADFAALRQRLMSEPDMWISQAGAMLTAVLACWAALETGIPGRSARWALLPVPAFAIWFGASTAGCLRLLPAAGTQPEPHMHKLVCMKFLLLVAVPLSAALGALLLRACPLRPGLTAALAGLASAAAASTLLALIHPFDATADDLLAHLAAVAIIVAVMRLLGPRMFARQRPGRFRGYVQ